MADETFREAIAKMVAEQDPHMTPTDPDWAASAFLLASVFLGPDPEAIATALELDPVLAGVYAERAQRNGIWTAAGVHSKGWEDPETGGVQFAMDLCVLAGFTEKVGPDSYRMTVTGKAHVERLLGLRKDDNG